MSDNLKDLVYTENGWVEDYFLTAEKNQEIYDLRTDLTQETSERKAQDNIFQETILANKKSTDEAIITINQTINREVTRVEEGMEEAFNLYNEKANQLGTAIEQEVQNRIAADTEIITNVENLNTNLTNYKTEASNTYTTKEESTSLHNDINKSITDLDTILRNEIATQVTGANKWVNESPIETLDDLNKLELDDNFNWLCRVTNENGYTYQRIAGSTEWKLYSKNDDYIDPTELDTALNTHDINNKAHNDIRASLTALTEVVDGLSGGTATDLSEIRNNLNTLETNFNSLETTTNQKIEKVEEVADELTSIIPTIVIKEEGKALSSNDYTNEDKEKLQALDSSLYEKLENKVTEIGEGDNNTYPTTQAVKTYVTELIPDVSKLDQIDLNNLVLKTGESQLINSGTTFTNFAIANQTNNQVFNSITTDVEGYLNIQTGLKTNEIHCTSFNYNNTEYGISGNNVSLDESYLLPTISQTKNLINQAITDYNVENLIKTNQTLIKANYIIYDESSLNLISNTENSNVILCANLTAGDQTIIGAILYNYIDNNWSPVKIVDTLFYADKVIKENQIINQLTLYGVTKIDDYTYNLEQIYPVTNIDLTDYVTNTSLTNTLNSYVTNTSLSNSLSSYTTTANFNTLSTRVTNLENAGYITSVPSEYITETELTAKGYATSSALNSLTNRVSTLETTGGQEGPQGPAGAAAGFGTTTGTVTMVSPSTSPSVSVTTSGDNTAKNFTFAFTLPKAATFTYSGTTLTITTT